MTIRTLIIFFTLFLAIDMAGQDHNLANQYFRDGEYEKAALIYKKLIDNPRGAINY